MWKSYPDRTRPGQRGFTFLEVIVFLVVLGAMGAFMFNFTQLSVEDSSNTVTYYQNEGDLRAMMEDITAQYKDMIANDNLSLSGLKNYAETQYSSAVVTAKTGYILFSSAGPDAYDASSISATYTVNSVLIITLGLGNQTVASIFTQ